MTTHIRKLLPFEENHNPIPYSSQNHTAPPHNERQNQTNHQNPPSSSTSSSPNCCYNSLKLNPPFDSAMALTVLVLLTALFFMGFFSIYIRRFAEDSSGDPTRRRRGSDTRSSTPTMTASSSFAASSTAKGVDPTTIKALPVHAYYGGGAKQKKMLEEMECAICLSEFEEREWIKQIPYCGHVFHVECIDTWLSSHVTCPLCRSAKLLVVDAAEEEVEKEGRGHVAGGDERRVSEVAGEVRLVVDAGDTWHDLREEGEVGPTRGERRSSSCSRFGERVRLHRSLSF